MLTLELSCLVEYLSSPFLPKQGQGNVDFADVTGETEVAEN